MRSDLALQGISKATLIHSLPSKIDAISVAINSIETDDKLKNENTNAIYKAINEIYYELNKLPLFSYENVNSLSINELIDNRIKTLIEMNTKYKQIIFNTNLSKNKSLTVSCNAFLIEKVIDILIENSMEAMKHLSTKTIKITSTAKNDFVEILISDNGCGISEEMQSIIFQKRIKSQQGLAKGTGLLLAQLIIETYKGEIKLCSSSKNGTTIAFKLPIETNKTSNDAL